MLAGCGVGGGDEGIEGVESAPVNDYHFPGFDLPLELRANEIEGTGLRGDEIRVLLTPQDQGPEPMGITHRDHLVLAQKEETISPIYLLESPYHPPG